MIDLSKTEIFVICVIINFWIFLSILPSLCKKIFRDFFTEKHLHEICKKEIK